MRRTEGGKRTEKPPLHRHKKEKSPQLSRWRSGGPFLRRPLFRLQPWASRDGERRGKKRRTDDITRPDLFPLSRVSLAEEGDKKIGGDRERRQIEGVSLASAAVLPRKLWTECDKSFISDRKWPFFVRSPESGCPSTSREPHISGPISGGASNLGQFTAQ